LIDLGLVVCVVVDGMWGFLVFVDLMLEFVVEVVMCVVELVCVLCLLVIECVELVFELVYMGEWVLLYVVDLFDVFDSDKIVVFEVWL